MTTTDAAPPADVASPGVDVRANEADVPPGGYFLPPGTTLTPFLSNDRVGTFMAAEQVLTVGKQLTNELYLGYEYGIESASQSVKLMYQLTRAVQAIARVGSESWGGEVKYSIRFD
mgnify:CR=1 FL=1